MTDPASHHTPVHAPHVARRWPTRLAIALLLGAGSAAVTLYLHNRTGKYDFQAFWWSAKALSVGANPYAAIGPAGMFLRWNIELPYPLPALLVIWPLTSLPLLTAVAIFTGVSGALLAWHLGRDHAAAWPVFLSASYLVALNLGQWSPLLTAAALSPWLGALLVAKPTIGAALFLYRPSRAAAIGCLLLIAASIAVMPTWPAEWWPIATADSTRLHYRTVIAVPGGALTLLALLRWKRPEARLLTVLACVPQTMIAYEFVPLFLVARQRWEGIALAVLSWIMLFLRAELARPQPGGIPDYDVTAQLGVLLMYLPAVVMVLRRPNEGDTPELLAAVRAWVDRVRAGGRPLPS